MISRVTVDCSSCGQHIVLRITVEGGPQPFIFACPYCQSEISGIFEASLDGPSRLSSEDFEVVERYEETGEELTVPVNTGVPVHTSLIGQLAKEAFMSPFILLTMNIGDKTTDVMSRINAIRGMREQLFPHARRAMACLRRRDIEGLKRHLRNTPGGESLDYSSEDPVSIVGRLVAQLYEPVEMPGVRDRTSKEFLLVIRKARTVDQAALEAEYENFAAGPLGRHHARAIDTAITVLDDSAALFPALFAEALDSVGNVAEYRVMRNDFDALKVRYQDMFELASRTLAFTSRIANIAYRKDVRLHSDGITRSFNKALNGTTAFNRESWASDFDEARILFDEMHRGLRNDIGHKLVRYEFESGHLVYEDGRGDNYLDFLRGYLNAVRLSHYVLDVCEILSYLPEMLSSDVRE